MSPETSPSDPIVTNEAAPPAKTRSNSFFRAKRTPLPHDDARRQGDISQLAFLNTENAELGGRPLAVATASDTGYEQVATAIRAWARDPGFE